MKNNNQDGQLRSKDSEKLKDKTVEGQDKEALSNLELKDGLYLNEFVFSVALNYGVFRRKQFSNQTQYFMFYDMGATSTTATVVGKHYIFVFLPFFFFFLLT